MSHLSSKQWTEPQRAAIAAVPAADNGGAQRAGRAPGAPQSEAKRRSSRVARDT